MNANGNASVFNMNVPNTDHKNSSGSRIGTMPEGIKIDLPKSRAFLLKKISITHTTAPALVKYRRCTAAAWSGGPTNIIVS